MDDSDSVKYDQEIRRRYRRLVGGHPDRSVTHDADCEIYSILGVCTCGLMHMLKAHPDPQSVSSLYERDLAKQSAAQEDALIRSRGEKPVYEGLVFGPDGSLKLEALDVQFRVWQHRWQQILLRGPTKFRAVVYKCIWCGKKVFYGFSREAPPLFCDCSEEDLKRMAKIPESVYEAGEA